MFSDLVARVSDEVFARLKVDGLEIQDLSPPSSVVAIITCAQGIIDNGGLRYFFERDFPGQPSYGLFVDAYRAIGADSEAQAIAEAVSAFGLSRPELQGRARFRLLEGPVGAQVERFDMQMCSDVWRMLDAYIREHETEFGR